MEGLVFHDACGRFWPVFRLPLSIRDHILALSSSRSKRQYWTVGNRPIRNNDLRSLRRNSVEAQIQDRSRQKTGLNTAPGFSRVYPSFPRTTPSQEPGIPPSQPPLRGAKGTRAQHAGDARKPPTPPLRSSEHQDNPSHHPPTTPVIPASHPSFPQAYLRHSRGLPRHSRGRGNPEKNKARRQTSPSRSEGDACAARRGCPKTTNSPPFEAPNTKTTPPSSPHPPSFPRAIRHSRGALRHSRGAIRHSRGRGNPEKNKALPPNLPFAERRGRVRSTQGMPENHQHPPSKLRTPRQPLHHPPTPSVIPASHPSFPRTPRHSRGRGNPEKNKAHRQTSPSPSEGDACAARRGCPKTTNTAPSKLRTPRQSISSFPSLKSHKSQFRRLR